MLNVIYNIKNKMALCMNPEVHQKRNFVVYILIYRFQPTRYVPHQLSGSTIANALIFFKRQFTSTFC